MGRLDGKVAAVTGGASGIGEATVRRFVAEGASVAFCDRDGERGQRVAAELEAAGAKVAFTQADVGTEAACLAFVNGAAQQFGRLDILINNAGIRKYEKVDEASAASWNEILSVNLMSYVFCAKAAVPLMRRNKGGAIVNTASVRSVVAGGGNLQYDTTKAAIAGLTRGLAADHSAEGIRVNAVGPGPIFTPFHARRIAAAGETVEQYNAKAAQGTMMKRPGRPEEVAAAILFLASDDASYVTGALLFVDGAVRHIQQHSQVRIARFAALLRDRQVVIAVHERALFDYLEVELSPAFPGDSLIAVEMTRTFEAKAVVTPRAFGFENDRAIAA
jgi:NAD(P)-dependent dehydrogenase (short-subunit alcohol dehydrogenase family)